LERFAIEIVGYRGGMDGDAPDDRPVDQPADGQVDEDEGLLIPAGEEQAERRPHDPEEEAQADRAARDTTVAGATDLPGNRFFGADQPSD